MKQTKKKRHDRVEYNEMKRIPIKADTYSLVNSIVPDYLALQSSLLPTNTSFRNTPRNCRTAERRYLTDKVSNPQLSNFSAMSLNASNTWKRRLQDPACSLRFVRNLWLHFPSCITTNNQVTIFVHLGGDGLI